MQNRLVPIHQASDACGDQVNDVRFYSHAALLAAERRPDAGEVMVAMADCMILEEELARERSIAIE